MSHRDVGQMSLADGLVGRGRKQSGLDRLGAAIDWSCFKRLLEGIYASYRFPERVAETCGLRLVGYGFCSPAPFNLATPDRSLAT